MLVIKEEIIYLAQIKILNYNNVFAVEDEYCTEQDLKDYVKEAYLKFRKFEE